jgi:glutamate formiminotransferase / 5-formyltetrahydrofolate cyclo-ligase
MAQIIQSSVNFSEGRRLDVIEQIMAVVKETPGVSVLSLSYDHDHNRSVLTFIGDLPAMEEAAFRLTAKAAQLIDMEIHRGGHPRMGATDVIPFIPIKDVTMAECVELAHRVGKRIGDKLEIPVYLYEEAATTPQRSSLADVRRGEYEGLKELIQNPDRIPDYGPAAMHKNAGAVAVGARRPLVAFNANLNTPDLQTAQKIANAVREKSGGLKNVRAIGLYLADRNITQVSMNLVNCNETPIYRVLELVKAEAARYGAHVIETEIVGLCPQKYLFDSLAYYMQLHTFNESQVVENRIQHPRGC